MKIIRWGIIGCGDVCEVKSGPGFQKAEGSALVAVMRRDGEKAADYARRHGVARSYDDADALIADPEVDAVYVATPPSSHADLTARVAAAGKPVYVEKPMAIDKSQCDAMVQACARARVPLFVAYYRRALPRFVAIKALLDQGAIGEVQAANLTLVQAPVAQHRSARGPAADLPWRLDPAIAGGGLFLDLGSHMVDLIDHLLGPIVGVQGGASNRGGLYEVEDTVAGSFSFASGVRATALWSFAAGASVDRTEIFGSEGRISFATFDEAPVVVETAEGIRQLQIAHPPHVQQPLIQNVVDCLRGLAVPISTGDNGARANGVMDQLLADYRQQHVLGA
jgi:1,5-anhydro-D-fructose reductase (1,5-anhydro-D-mannitol-forming)